MAELWNYLIVAGATPTHVAQHAAAALAARGWRSVDRTETGALRLQVWSSGDLTVAELQDWGEPDLVLARELARRSATPVAVSHHDGAGETELYAYFDAKGRKTKSPTSGLGRWASARAADLVPAGPPLELAFEAPVDAATRTALGALQRWVRPILSALEFEKTRVEVRYHPSIDAVLAWWRPLGAGRRLLVRYDYNKGELLTECTQTLMLLDARGEHELSKLTCDHSSHWRGHPELIERDFEMFAASLLEALHGQLPADLRARLEPFEPLQKRADELLRQRRVLRVLEPGERPAKVLFRGERLLTVRAQDLQFTFRFDTSEAPVSDAVAIGDIVELRGGARTARKLRVADRVFSFDDLGQLTARESANG